MEKQIQITITPEAENFIDNLSEKVQRKFTREFGKVTMGIRANFSKLNENIWEFSVDGDNNFYRLFAFWDKAGKHATLIVCTHGIEKEKNKTPKKEIEKSEKIRQQYFDS